MYENIKILDILKNTYFPIISKFYIYIINVNKEEEKSSQVIAESVIGIDILMESILYATDRKPDSIGSINVTPAEQIYWRYSYGNFVC